MSSQQKPATQRRSAAGRRRPARPSQRPWLWVVLGLLALATIGGFLAAGQGGGSAGAALVAGRSSHDFGKVSINDGPVNVLFPLTVRDAVLVTDLYTS